jgi:hypothetical protein
MIAYRSSRSLRQAPPLLHLPCDGGATRNRLARGRAFRLPGSASLRALLLNTAVKNTFCGTQQAKCKLLIRRKFC